MIEIDEERGRLIKSGGFFDEEIYYSDVYENARSYELFRKYRWLLCCVVKEWKKE